MEKTKNKLYKTTIWYILSSIRAFTNGRYFRFRVTVVLVVRSSYVSHVATARLVSPVIFFFFALYVAFDVFTVQTDPCNVRVPFESVRRVNVRRGRRDRHWPCVRAVPDITSWSAFAPRLSPRWTRFVLHVRHGVVVITVIGRERPCTLELRTVDSSVGRNGGRYARALPTYMPKDKFKILNNNT